VFLSLIRGGLLDEAWLVFCCRLKVFDKKKTRVVSHRAHYALDSLCSYFGSIIYCL